MSRVNPRNSSSHQILGIQTERPDQLATQLMLDIQNAWGILHAIIDYCRELEPGKYIIMKDPNKVNRVTRMSLNGMGLSLLSFLISL